MLTLSSLARLRRTYLDLEFSTPGAARVRIVERPARWMSEEQLAKLVEDLRRVVQSAVTDGTLEYGVVTGDPERLGATILTVIYREDGSPVAFNALSVMDCELRGKSIEVLHLGLVVVDPSYRSRGITRLLYGLTCFLVFARHRMRPLWVSNVTQVPAVFGLVSEGLANVFPTPSQRYRRSFDHVCLARQIMTRHRHVFGVGSDAEFDEARFVIANAYTGGSDNLKKSFADSPKHRDAAFNAMCERELDYERGDDFLQIGQWTLASSRWHFTRFRAVVSPTYLAMRFAFLLLESLIAPALQWFDPAHAMGELRPCKASP